MSCGGRVASQPGQNGLKKFLRQLSPESANPAVGRCSAATAVISVGFGPE
jgi:hypothetical protein